MPLQVLYRATRDAVRAHAEVQLVEDDPDRPLLPFQLKAAPG